MCIAEGSHSAMKALWAGWAKENRQDLWENTNTVPCHRVGKWYLVMSYLKILKNSLKLKRFKIDVFKYSSKTWKRSVTATVCWEDNSAGTEASYLQWQTIDYRHIWIIVFKPSSFQNCSLEVFVYSAERQCLSSSSSTNQHLPQKLIFYICFFFPKALFLVTALLP